MYQLMLNRKNSRKGFTLVEVIVVLVILAILAAIMIPAMTGWIDKAREKAIIVEARTVYLAAVTLAAEDYGAQNATATCTGENAAKLADVGDVTTVAGYIKTLTPENGKVTAFVYEKGGMRVTLTNGSLIASKVAAGG